MKYFKQCIIAVLLLVSAPMMWADDFVELEWEDLMPEGWEPPEPVFNEETGFFSQSDAPLVMSLDARSVKIPGYVLPIKYDDQNRVLEFLLVPYLGACIHVPPPPENQMVYVRLKQPLVAAQLWDPVWVMGRLQAEKVTTEYAVAGYMINAAETAVYEL